MGRFSSLPNYFVAFWYINNVFDSQHVVFDTLEQPQKSLKFKRKLRRVHETGPWGPCAMSKNCYFFKRDVK